MNKKRGICWCVSGQVGRTEKKAYKAGPCRGANLEETPQRTKQVWVQKSGLWTSTASCPEL